MKIGSNISALQAQRRLGESSSALAKTFERLSSGQRINRAADDAAGLAIAESLRSNSRVFNQGVRNVNDGISMFAIAEGAIGQLKNITVRQRELATQAASGSYSLAQRLALEKERLALEDEYNRIIRSTAFNGRNVFDESQGVLVLQAGYGSGGALRASADNTLDFSSLPMRVSTDSGGGEAGGISRTAQITPDGRFLIFQSGATNLVSGDTNGQADIFLKDLSSGEVRLVSTDSSGGQANSQSRFPQLTPDGRFVVFESFATNLVSGDTNGTWDIFWKDLESGETRRVSTDGSGGQAGAASSYPQITPDGRFVVFQSGATNLVSGDTNSQADIFVKDLLSGETRLVSTNSSGVQAAAGGSGSAQMTPDGRFVIFESSATNLVSEDTNGQSDIFIKDLLSGETRRVNTDSSGNQSAGGFSSTARPTSDGRYVVFTSTATNLVSGDTNGAQSDIFVKDLLSGEIRRVNTDSSGGQAVAGVSSSGQLSPDGRFVLFESSSSNLVSGDTNTQYDVFLKDLLSGETRRLSVDSNGNQGTGIGMGSYSGRFTADGRYVIFGSDVDNLISGDTNGQGDIFLTANPLADRFSLALQYGTPIATQSGASYMQTFLDRQLGDLNVFHGQLGTIQRRLSVAANVLGSMNQNIAAAESRIRDADIAEEAAQLTRTSIVQQSASAILAQTNQSPALALLLLG